jgi:hypothetical protein
MATQRIILVKIGGIAANTVAEMFDRWLASRIEGDAFPDNVQDEVDCFAESLRGHAADLPVVYYAEWIDMWSMGDVVPALRNRQSNVVYGRRFEASCRKPPINFRPGKIANSQVQEEVWLSKRLQEACRAWKPLVTNAVIVIVREPLGAIVEDEELMKSLESVPDWLTQQD